MNEEWRQVVGYENVYSVSNLGRVRRDAAGKGANAGYILKQSILQRPGYYRVGLVVNGKQTTRTVHSLVAEAFIGPPLGLCVNHKDGNKLNNLPANLEYVTLAENNRHARATGLCTPLVEICCRGHRYDEENTKIRKDRNQRECRQCARENNRKHKLKVRAQKAAA